MFERHRVGRLSDALLARGLRLSRFLPVLASAMLTLGGCATTQAPPSTPPSSTPSPSADTARRAQAPPQGHSGAPSSAALRTQLGAEFYVEELGEGVWRHVSYKTLPEVGPFPSNGLVIASAEGLLLIDTPWTPEQTRTLIAWAKQTLRKEVREVIITHAHDDRYGGSQELTAVGATLRARPQTVERARSADHWELPAKPLDPDVGFEFAGERIDVFFPGAAHAPDNVVVWFPSRKLLFGGCMIRAADAKALGNLADADVNSWASAISKIIDRYPTVGKVVPGHGEPGGRDLLLHTQALVTAKLESEKAPPR